MDSDEGTLENLSGLTSLPSSFDPILDFTDLDDLDLEDLDIDDLLADTFNDSVAPSTEPILVKFPQQTEISSSRPKKVDNINSVVVPSAVHGVEMKQLYHESEVDEKVTSKRKYVAWTEKEHGLFLEGLEKYDKGKRSKIWKKISTEFVFSKTPREVASHAQKYYLRQKIDVGKRQRPSINDIARPV